MPVVKYNEPALAVTVAPAPVVEDLEATLPLSGAPPTTVVECVEPAPAASTHQPCGDRSACASGEAHRSGLCGVRNRSVCGSGAAHCTSSCRDDGTCGGGGVRRTIPCRVRSTRAGGGVHRTSCCKTSGRDHRASARRIMRGTGSSWVCRASVSDGVHLTMPGVAEAPAPAGDIWPVPVAQYTAQRACCACGDNSSTVRSVNVVAACIVEHMHLWWSAPPPAPAVIATPVPLVEYTTPAPAGIAAPAPVAEYRAPVAAVIAATAPMVEYVAPAPAGIAALATTTVDSFSPTVGFQKLCPAENSQLLDWHETLSRFP